MLRTIYRGHEEKGFFAQPMALSPEPDHISVLPDNERRAASSDCRPAFGVINLSTHPNVPGLSANKYRSINKDF